MNTRFTGGVGVNMTTFHEGNFLKRDLVTSLKTLNSETISAFVHVSNIPFTVHFHQLRFPALFFGDSKSTEVASVEDLKAAARAVIKISTEFNREWKGLAKSDPKALREIEALFEERRQIKSRLNRQKDGENYFEEIAKDLISNYSRIHRWLIAHSELEHLIRKAYPHSEYVSPTVGIFAPKSLLQAFVMLYESVQSYGGEVSPLRQALRNQMETGNESQVSTLSFSIYAALFKNPEMCADLRKISFQFRKMYYSRKGDVEVQELDALISARYQLMDQDLDNPSLNTEDVINRLNENAKAFNQWMVKYPDFMQSLEKMYLESQANPHLEKYDVISLYLMATDREIQSLCREVSAHHKK
ncbi:MAG: hypothetical protein H7A32_00525 [Deltaproteobacteria bacterium]|nr:hypothetical protein [Deltaproteobacteria bacterium]